LLGSVTFQNSTPNICVSSALDLPHRWIPTASRSPVKDPVATLRTTTSSALVPFLLPTRPSVRGSEGVETSTTLTPPPVHGVRQVPT
jgi:hypothetical protein